MKALLSGSARAQVVTVNPNRAAVLENLIVPMERNEEDVFTNAQAAAFDGACLASDGQKVTSSNGKVPILGIARLDMLLPVNAWSCCGTSVVSPSPQTPILASALSAAGELKARAAPSSGYHA